MRDVAGIALCVDGMALGQFRSRGLNRLFVEIDDGDLGAEFSQAFGETASQDSASAGHDGGASLEVEQILERGHDVVSVNASRLRSSSSTSVKSRSESMSTDRSSGISNSCVSG